jgi:hypothetical protein
MLAPWIRSQVSGPSVSNKSIRRAPRKLAEQLQSSISILKARQCAKITEFRDALIASGFDSLDAQAGALGLSRSSTWMILNRNHKATGLSSSVINRIMHSTRLPSAARAKLEEYVRERLTGQYGHPPKCLRRFRSRLLTCPETITGSPQQSDPDERAGGQTANYRRRVAIG